MNVTRRRFIKTGITSTAGLMAGSSLSLIPSWAYSNGAEVFTVSFSGTGCSRDEGEMTRPGSSFYTGSIQGSDKRIYLPETGYIPVRINQELGGVTQLGGSAELGQIVRGVGENDWALPRTTSEPLIINGPLTASNDLRSYILNGSFVEAISSYASGDQRSFPEQAAGFSMPALALHGANLAAASGASQYNLIGHSRGGCECIMAAWFLYAYGDAVTRNTPVNIFAIDPVPGPGYWYGILTQLPPNVVNYVGVYAWDHLSHPFQALVPRPNGRMRGEANGIILHQPTNAERDDGYEDWMVMADQAQQRDPLAPSNFPQPVGYELYSCRGKHGTVAGNTTADGQYDPSKNSARTAPVPALIYKMARAYLTQWGTTFTTPCAIAESVVELRKKIHLEHRDFDSMGEGELRNSIIPDRPWVRRVSSISGNNPINTYFMDDVVGDPPYKLAFPVTKDRKNEGWVRWKFL